MFRPPAVPIGNTVLPNVLIITMKVQVIRTEMQTTRKIVSYSYYIHEQHTSGPNRKYRTS